TDLIRNNPPAVGTTVTFKYHGFSKNGVPKFASFLRARKD
ncbi:MAG: DNA ligase, partial [Desulfobacter sp.]|nr:DNA ligase [Desulfobacter sp.]